MQNDAVRIRVVNNTDARDLDDRTRNFLIAPGMKVTERGESTGASNQTIVVVYSRKQNGRSPIQPERRN